MLSFVLLIVSAGHVLLITSLWPVSNCLDCFSPGFLSLSTMDVWDHIILYDEGCPAHCRMFNSVLTTTHWRTTHQAVTTKNVFIHYPVSAGVGVGEVATDWEPLVQTNKWISTKHVTDTYTTNPEVTKVCTKGNKGNHLADLEQITGLVAKNPSCIQPEWLYPWHFKSFESPYRQLKYWWKCVCTCVCACVCVGFLSYIFCFFLFPLICICFVLLVGFWV